MSLRSGSPGGKSVHSLSISKHLDHIRRGANYRKTHHNAETMTLWRTLYLITTIVVKQVGLWPDVGVHRLCVHGAKLAPSLGGTNVGIPFGLAWTVDHFRYTSGKRGR